MNSLNKVQLIGNLTADPEVRETPSGQRVASFSIATNRTWKDQAGVKQEQVEYHNIVVWGRLAEIVEQYCQKGKKIYVEGRLQTRSWDDQSGAKRYKTEVVAENVILLSAAGQGSGGGFGGGNSYGGGNSFGGSQGSADDGVFSDETPDEVSPPKAKRTAKKSEEDIHIEDIPF